MEFRVPTLSLYHPGLPDSSDDGVRALNYSSDQAVSYTDNNALSNSTRILGAKKEQKYSDTSGFSTTNFVEEISRSDEIVSGTSSVDTSYFSTQAAFPPEQVACCSSSTSTLSTSSNKRSQSSASRLSLRYEAIWSDKVEEAFQQGLPQIQDLDCNH